MPPRRPKRRPPPPRRRRRRKMAPPPPKRGPRRGKLAKLRKLQDTVEANDRATAAARIHPRLRKGKKCPPMALVPPRPNAPKKQRVLWMRAADIADAEAADELDLEDY